MGAGSSVQGGAAAATVTWGETVVPDELVDERAAAERKKARKEARAKRRQAECQPAESSGSFAAQRSTVEIIAARHEKVDLEPHFESTNRLPLVEAEARRTRHSDGSADKRHEPKRQHKKKRHGKENFPRVSPRKTDHRPCSTPTKCRAKHGIDRRDVQSDWKMACSSRYKDPRLWRVQNRPTYNEFKKSQGLENDMFTRRHSAAASISPQPLLLVGDRALAVKVGKTVAFSDAANETHTFEATGKLRRRRSDSHKDRRK